MFIVEYHSYDACNIDQYILITDCWKGVYGSFFKLGILLDAKQKKMRYTTFCTRSIAQRFIFHTMFPYQAIIYVSPSCSMYTTSTRISIRQEIMYTETK